ncbi:MAG: PucR family transcriptional regulator [Firmicutes bacterium]|nr:PucR family transcriptional regulator [Alicyclobacillaceae bacterium]MCL6496078.1 PucR family transcriptional regulator [Bacillota bacterium]
MLTVRDVLQRPAFQGAAVVAGSRGLGREVKWVHVGEIPNLAEFLSGGEFILSTGMCLTQVDTALQFVGGLIDVGAAALAVEIGQYVDAVPAPVVALAEARDFPLLAFPRPVRFRDLSYDVNALLFNQHYRDLADLEDLSRRLRQSLLNTEGIPALLGILYRALGRPLWFQSRMDTHPPVVLGPWAGSAPPRGGPTCSKPEPTGGDPPRLLQQSVVVFGRAVADVFVELEAATVPERVYLALDHAVAAIAQEYLRLDALDRVRRDEDAALLEPLLSAPVHLAAARRFESVAGLNQGRLYTVAVGAGSLTALGRDLEPLVPGLAAFHLHTSEQELAVLVFDAGVPVARVARALSTWARERQTAVGLSWPHGRADEMALAVGEAQGALEVARRTQTWFQDYGELGCYRLFLALDPRELHRLLVEPVLGPLLRYEKTHGLPLVATLEAVLTSSDSKRAIAERLRIGRQTLYYRIKLLHRLLGPRAFSDAHRVTLEVALLAYRFLSGRDAGDERLRGVSPATPGL